MVGRASILSLISALAACSPFESETSKGRAVADRWCAECHRVAVDQPSGSRAGHVLPPPVAAPSFMAVAARPGMDAPQLRRFMAELHLPMPIYRLSAGEREAVIQYILSLGPPGS
jgi:mono/diheme cytochrome c family protein